MTGPIFIAGDGRSGTTLLSVILDANPALAIGPELHFRGPKNLGQYILDVIDIKLRVSDEEWDACRYDSELRNAFHFVQRVARFGVDALTLRSLILAYVDRGVALDEFEQRCALVEEIARRKAAVKNVGIWGMKIMRDLPLYRKYLNVWPDALFVHIVRDGRDVAASQMIDHAGWGYSSITGAAEGWCKMLAAAEKVPADRILNIRYEDLVDAPEKTAKVICGFIGIPWSSKMMNHAEQGSEFLKNHYQHPSGEQVRKPVSAASIGRYKNELQPSDVAEFEGVACEYLKMYGYV